MVDSDKAGVHGDDNDHGLDDAMLVAHLHGPFRVLGQVGPKKPLQCHNPPDPGVGSLSRASPLISSPTSAD